MSRRMQLAAVLLSLFAVTSPAAGQATKQQGNPKAASAREASDRIWADFGAALKKGDATAILATYTDDAVMIDPGAATLSGKAAIGDFVKGFFANGKVTEHSHVVEGFETDGDIAIEHGRWKLGYQEKGKAKPDVTDARYILVWKRGADGKWLLHRDVSIPNPTPAPKK